MALTNLVYLSQFLPHLRYFLLHRPGLSFLILILSIMTLGILKPEFYLIGWDNFSSYLNPSDNIFNTLFGTWREHRGVGVPSDAEINDIFRQVFSAVVSFFVGKQLVDQLYMVVMLWGGVLGMYALGRKISQTLKHTVGQQELFGFIAAFFYLLNLSTLSVFYFPMIMYNTRFFMLPITLLVILHLLDNKHISPISYLILLTLLLIGFGSFMVPTLYIVIAIMLMLFFLFMKKTKRLVLVLGLFVLLGMYWMLPFANYTIQKSSIVPEAPTFITINEAMLNKPKSYYSFEKQAKLRPSFFESQFKNISTNTQTPFHPLAADDEKGWKKVVLWIFPILYLLGIAYTVVTRKSRLMLWFASITVIFLILSMKEYSPLGPLYTLISEHVPFANTLFRFGDTKFHAVVAFGGSVIAAFLITDLLNRLRRTVFFTYDENTVNIWHLPSLLANNPKWRKIVKYTLYTLGVLIILLHLLVYKSYFNGNFIGFFMYNKIPTAYFDIAKIINEDTDHIRVVHLPIDPHSYWKPYSWGYFGSSFLHFMINKPVFDRSFEPASRENADIHKQLQSLVDLAASVPNDSALEERADTLYYFLQSLSVKYIIDDQTVSTNVDARNIQYWGTINTANSQRLLSYLEKKGSLKLVKQYEISVDSYAEAYKKLYPYNGKNKAHIYEPRTIKLYEVKNPHPRLQLLDEAEVVITDDKTFLPPKLARNLGDFIQPSDNTHRGLIFPFTGIPQNTRLENDQIKLSLPYTLKKGSYLFENINHNSLPDSQMVKVSVQKQEDTLTVFLQNITAPDITGTIRKNPQIITSINLVIESDEYSSIAIDQNILTLPNLKESEVTALRSVMVHGSGFPVYLLYPESTYDLSAQLKQFEPNPQCLNDGFGKKESHITGDNETLKISGQNVSNCLTTDYEVPAADQRTEIVYAELQYETLGTTKVVPETKKLPIGKQKLNQYLDQTPSPLTMETCIKSEGSDICMNKDKHFPITQNKTKYTVPIHGDLTGIHRYLITFIVRGNPEQAYDTTTTNISLKTYTAGEADSVSIYQPSDYSDSFVASKDTQLELAFPLSESPYTHRVDLVNGAGLLRQDENCNEENRDQTFRKGSHGVLMYVVNCRDFAQKNVAFSSNNFYLWSTEYRHFAGEVPSLILNDKLNTYFYTKLNPTSKSVNDYFSIPFQGPESLFTSQKSIENTLNKAGSYTIAGFLEPEQDLNDNKNKEFILQQHSENEGLLELSTMSLIELPSSWATTLIKPVDYTPQRFTEGRQITYKRILPSLWKVSLTSSGGQSLVQFSEQFDTQWRLLKAPEYTQLRCNNYFNCYQITLPTGETQFYIFYLPELLNFTGLVITVLSALSGYFMLNKLKRNH